MSSPPPLTGIRVLEFAGLAPGPFAGMLLADYGASVIRLDRASATTHSTNPPAATADQLVRHKTSISVNMKSPAGIAFIKSILPHVDVVIDPFRPGVLEKAGLCPHSVMLPLNRRLVVARMTGFRREGKYSQMAGHDINYIAVAGVLSLFGRAGERPYAPANVVGDFAGGGAVCVLGVLLALLARARSGQGQVVEANMVDGASGMATFPRLGQRTPFWAGERGTNMLDGGSPFYDTYETADGKYMAVGALEPQFYAELLRGLELQDDEVAKNRNDISAWPRLRELFARTFKSKTRKQWEDVFDGTDACCTPVLELRELEQAGFDQRPVVTLRDTPGLALAATAVRETDEAVRAAKGQGQGVDGHGWSSKGLRPSQGGEKTLQEWLGWTRGKNYDVVDGGLVLKDPSKL